MIYAIIILIALIIFVISVGIFDKIYKLTQNIIIKWQWVLLVIFILTFISAYILFGIDLLLEHQFLSADLTVTLTFLCGSIYVLVCSTMFFKIIKHLDKRVKDRTKKLELQHKKTIKKEKEIQRLKDQFIFVAAHELSTPVNATKWSIELLHEDPDFFKKLTKEQKELCQNIHDSNNYLVSLVQDLLETSRIEYGTIKINPEKFYLEKIIEQTVRELSYLAKEKKIQIKFKKSKNKQVFADPQRAKEIITNLITNAIKYNLPNGQIIIETKQEKNFLIINVTDTGVGLTKEEKKKLFHKFCRLENTQTRDEPGTGLGLFITKRIVEQMGGKIKVNSPGRNKGTTFTFTLPIK